MNKFKTYLFESDNIIIVIVYVSLIKFSQWWFIFNIPESYKLDDVILTMMIGLPVLMTPVALLIYFLIIIIFTLIFTWRGGEFKWAVKIEMKTINVLEK